MKLETCPNDADLKAHMLGELTGEDADAIDKLLESCESCTNRAEGSCMKRVEEMNAADPLMAALGSGPVEIEGDEEVVSAIIEKASTLNNELDSTNANKKAADISTSNVDLSFLNPSQDENELGRLGPFRILQVLGVGGMGVVLKAEDPNLSREIALKVMKPEIAAGNLAKQRFLREARATAAIDHDNIVTIHQVDEDGGVPYLAMPFLKGESLRDRVKREKKLPARDILKIAKEVAAGLGAAHAAGLIHRDIKPDNIWLEDRNSSDQSTSTTKSGRNKYRVKIVDFGLARADDDINITQSGAIMGTPRYMSPEQANGDVADHRTDLFSLGGVLYHLATGRGPFDRKSLPATLFAVINDEPKPVAESRKDLPEELSELIDKLLQKKPIDRPQSADEVVDVINQILRDRVTKSTVQMAPKKKPKEPTSKIVELPPKPSRKKPRFSPLLIGLAALAPIFLAWGIVLLFDTPEGTLRVEVNGDDIEVLVDNKVVKLKNKQAELTKELKPLDLKLKLAGVEIPFDPETQQFVLDEGQIKVTFGKTELRSNSFEVVKNRTTVLRINFIPVMDIARLVKKQPAIFASLNTSHIAHHFPFDGNVKDVVGRVEGTKIGNIQISRNSIAGQGCLKGPNTDKNSRLEISGVANSFFQNDFSVAMWIRFDQPIDNLSPRLIEAIIRTPGQQPREIHGVALHFDKPKFYCSSFETHVIGERFLQGRWYHVATTRDKSKSTLYVNGKVVSSTTNTRPVEKPESVTVAGVEYLPRAWNGLIDELTIFKTTLSPNEVAALANNPRLVSNLVSGPSDGTQRFNDKPLEKVPFHLQAKSTPRETVPSLQKGELIQAHPFPVIDAEFTPDGRRLVTTSNRGLPKSSGSDWARTRTKTDSVVVWDVASKTQLRRFWIDAGSKYGPIDFDISPDGRLVLVGAGLFFPREKTDARIYCWDIETGESKFQLDGSSKKPAMRAVAFSQDGSKFFILRSGIAIKRDTATSEMEQLTPLGPSAALGRSRWTPDRKYIFGLNALPSSEFAVWDSNSTREVKTFKGHTQPITDMDASKDNSRFLSCATDLSIRLWDFETGKEIWKVENLDSAPICVRFSPDEKFFLSGSADGTVALFETETGKELTRIQGHDDRLKTIAFSKDGTSAVSGSDDGTVRLWKLNQPVRLAETESGWTSLFDGKTLKGWKVHGTPVWDARDGSIMGTTRQEFGWLGTDLQYQNFELEFEYQIAPGGNSGIFLRASETGDVSGKDFLEIQLMDDGAADKKKIRPSVRTGSLFEKIAPNPIPNPKPDEWHRVRIHLVDSDLKVEFNGNKVLDGRIPSGSPSIGHIGLQIFSGRVLFRDIRLRPVTSEWTSLFDGKTLKGWSGQPGFWRVEDGAIVGQATRGNTLKHNTCLVWQGGDVHDFELELDYKIESGNSGVQFRSFRVTGGNEWRLGGYQADFESGDRYNGGMYGEASRRILANRGEKVEINADGKPNVLEKFGSPEYIQNLISGREWNRLRIVAVGNHITQYINGVKTVDLIDNDIEGYGRRMDSGLLGLQLHKGLQMTVRFRDIRLKKLDNTAVNTQSKPETTKPEVDWIVGNWKFTERGKGHVFNMELRADGTADGAIPPEVIREIKRKKQKVPKILKRAGKWSKNDDGSYDISLFTPRGLATARSMRVGEKVIGRNSAGTWYTMERFPDAPKKSSGRPVSNNEGASVDQKTTTPITQQHSPESPREIAAKIFELGGGVSFVNKRQKNAYRIADLPKDDFVINHVGYANKYLTIGREHILVLSGLPHLETLYFGQTKLTDAAIDEITKLKDLEELYVKKCNFNNAHLSKLKTLPKLEMMELFHTELTNDGLKVLAEFPALRRMTLENATKAKFGDPIIDDAGLVHLANCKKLEILWLMGPNFTDAAVEHLVKIKSLRSLNIGAHGITQKGFEELKKRMHGGCNVTLASRLTNPGNINYLDRSVPMSNFEEKGTVIDTKVGTTSMAVSPDGKLIATSSEDQLEKISIWDANTGKLITQFKSPGDFTSAPFRLAFSPDSKSLLMAVQNQVAVVSAKDGKLEKSFEFPDPPKLVVFPKQTIALAVYYEKPGHRTERGVIPQNVRIWNWKTGKTLLDESISMDRGTIRNVSVSPDERFLITCRQNYANKHELKFDGEEASLGKSVDFEYVNRIRSKMVFSNDGKYAAYSIKGKGGMAAIFDAETRQVLHLIDPETAKEENGGYVYGCYVVFANDGSSYFTSDHTGRIAQWETKTGKLAREIGYLKTTGSHITPLIAITKDNRVIVAGGKADPRIVIVR